MYQLNVMLNVGDMTHDGHEIVGWDRAREGRSRAFHPEFFDSIDALDIRCKQLDAQGVRWKYGKATGKRMMR